MILRSVESTTKREPSGPKVRLLTTPNFAVCEEYVLVSSVAAHVVPATDFTIKSDKA